MIALHRSLILLSMLVGAPAAWSQNGAGALNRDDFAFEAPIRGSAGAPMLALDLPLEVYVASRVVGLGDLRVINAAGEAVPFTVQRVPASTGSGASRTVDALAFYSANAVGPTEDVTLSKVGSEFKLVIGPDASRAEGRSLKAYYADLKDLVTASDAAPLIQSVTLNLNPGPDVNATVLLEASGDLKSWQTLAGAAPVLRLSSNGQTLGNSKIELTPHAARYLRLSWRGASAPFDLASLTVQTVGAAKPRPIRWLSLNGVKSTDQGAAPARGNEFIYDAPAALPVSRFNLDLIDRNTLAPVNIAARAASDQAWRAVRSDTAFRMNTGDSESVNPDWTIDDAGAWLRQWRVQIDERAGAFAQKIPTLKLGFTPARLIFIARGEPPFTVLIGNARVRDTALSVQDFPANQPLAEAPANAELDLTQSVRRAGLGPEPIDDSSARRRKWLLWTMLIGGVIGLTLLALRLLKDPAHRPAGGPED